MRKFSAVALVSVTSLVLMASSPVNASAAASGGGGRPATGFHAQPTGSTVTKTITRYTNAPSAKTSANVLQSGANIFLISADCGNSESSLIASLLAQPGVASVDLFDAGAGTPTLAQLENHDAAVVFSDCAFLDQTTLGDNLADYEDAGGVVVAFNFDWYGGTQSIGGRWQSGGYSPFQNSATTLFSAGTLGTHDATSPLMQGVSALGSLYRENVTTTAGATLVANWNDGPPLLAYKGHAVAASAYIGDYSGNYSGDWARMIVNAIYWLSSNIVANPGFETGDFTSWTVNDTNPAPAVTGNVPHTGTYSAHVGSAPGGETPGDSSFYEQLTVPGGTSQLSYWYWPRTVDSISFDWQDAYVTNTSGTILDTIMHVCSNSQTWTHVTFNMTPYAGQTVRIEFLSHGDNAGDPTDMYVDDVELIGTEATLTVNKTGSGSGSVSSTPSGIDCGGTCSTDFIIGSSIDLAASPDVGTDFGGWSGGGCSGTGGCTAYLGGNTTVDAQFLAIRTLAVSKSGSGSGTVTSTPSGIDCGGTCFAKFDDGQSVTLHAVADSGSVFLGWSGGGCSGTADCVMSISGDTAVNAAFAVLHTLTVSKAGVGTGTVTSSPTGIDCGGTCSYDFAEGSAPTLTAVADTNSSFMGWSGAGCSGTGTCVVPMSGDASVTATFALNTTSLTIKAPSSVPAGTKVKIKGVLSSDDGDMACVSAQTVMLHKGSKDIGPKLTSGTGAYSFATKITKKTAVQVTYAGSASCGGSSSATKTIKVT